jgi:uncharacterized protein with HEPN domain
VSRSTDQRVADILRAVDRCQRYFGVDADTVRDVVEAHLPPLAEVLREHLV